MFEAFIFDLDGTLYDYDHCHEKALSGVLSVISDDYGIPFLKLRDAYNDIRERLKNEVMNTSSSHSRIIYFKHISTTFNLDYNILLSIEEEYWNIFIDSMIPFNGVLDLFKLLHKRRIKIGILTNFTLKIQLKKLEKLGLLQYIDSMMSSEENLIEKPNKAMFTKSLHDLNVKRSQVVMVGDSFSNDIEPALNLDILSFYLNRKQSASIIYKKGFISFSSFDGINLFTGELLDELSMFKKYSRKIGERYDLVQAGGGNVSFKFGELMFIKSSGMGMSEIDIHNGYNIIYLPDLINDINKNGYQPVESYNMIKSKKKPSIETYMHGFMDKYTVHIHPIIFLKLLIEKNIAIPSFLKDALIISYFPPGKELSKQIYKQYKDQNLILLENHGIIIAGDSWTSLFTELENFLKKMEMFFNVSMDNYRYVNFISELQPNNVTYLSEDIIIKKTLNDRKELFIENNYFPDKIVYCGTTCIFLDNLDAIYIKEFIEQNGHEPKIFIYLDNVYISAPSLKKCKQIEELLKCNLILCEKTEMPRSLQSHEVDNLLNRDDEKYRNNV